MFLVKITITQRPVDEEKLALHRQWFQKYFDAGKFLIVGPFTDMDAAGVVIAKVDSRQEMEQIISRDGFYPDGAEYELHEFKANLIAADIKAD